MSRPVPASTLAARWQRLPVARQVLLAAGALLVVYVALSFVTDPGGYLGTDTGGKVTTLAAMHQHDTWTDPDVGYWAEQWDPAGELHPFFGTKHINGHWVQVTTLPMILAAEPLYRLGGYRAALLLPMLGGVACALAARALARQLRAKPRVAWWAFWLIGLASPVLIYSLDLWEHTLGLAAMAWGTVALLHAVRRERAPGMWRGLVSYGALTGLAFGAAATMRSEALVYVAVFTAGACLTMLWRDRSLARPLLFGAATSAATAGVFLANVALERAILGSSIRSGRTAGAASGAGSDVALRLREGWVTTFGISPSATQPWLTLSALGVVLVGWVAWRGRDDGRVDERFLAVLVLGAASIWLLRFADGLGFVSGLFGALPIAAAGVVAVRDHPERRLPVGLALATLPVIWATQYTGGAGPQWGGRYVLLSGFVLGVVGVVSLPRLHRLARRSLVALAVVVTAFGFVWMVQRTHDTSRGGRVLSGGGEPVLVFQRTLGFVPREFAAHPGAGRWLVASDPGEEEQAARITRQAGFESFGFVTLHEAEAPARIGGFARGDRRVVPFLDGIDLYVTTFRLAPSS